MKRIAIISAVCFLFAAFALSGCARQRPAPITEHRSLSTVPAAAPTATLSWTSAETNVTFNLYSGPAPQALALRANTVLTNYTVPRTNAQEYFGVRALRNGRESPWAEVPR